MQPLNCSVAGCPRPVKHKGLCGSHYHRARRHGDPCGGKPSYVGVKCSEAGCDAEAHARGLCRKHYGRLYYRQNPAKWKRTRAQQRRASALSRARRERLGRSEHNRKQREWRKANRDKVLAANRRYNAKRPEVLRTARAKWDERHPYAKADASQTRRARKRGQFVEKVYKSKVLRLHGGFCGVCGELVDPHDWHLDHVVPLARGGEHSYANTQPAHPVCNLRKAAREVIA